MAGDANQKVTQDNLSQRCMGIHSNVKLLEDAIDRLEQDIGVLQDRKQRLERCEHFLLGGSTGNRNK